MGDPSEVPGTSNTLCHPNLPSVNLYNSYISALISAHPKIVNEMKAVGLIEDLPWEHPPVVSSEERTRLAKKLSHGKPLSEIIVEDRLNH
jgi:hypothetical protein